MFIGPCIIFIVEYRWTNLMSLALLFHYLMLNMFRMLVQPFSEACDLLWIYVMWCIALVRCVLVLRCGSAGWCGIFMQAFLMSLVLLFHYLLLNMFRMLVHPSSGACDLLWIYFMCCIALVWCVLVLQCGLVGWCGIFMQAEALLQPA